MNHVSYDTLSRYVDMELLLPERREVELHLRSCAECAEAEQALRRIDRAIVNWGTRQLPVPPGVDVRLAHTLEKRPRRNRIVRAVPALPPLFGTLAAAAVLAFVANVGNPLRGVHGHGSPSATFLPPSVREQASILQRNHSESAILGVRVSAPSPIATHHQVLLDVE